VKNSRTIAFVLFALSTLSPQLSTVHAQGTAFTYRGQLNDGGSPASGSYDLRFAIYGGPGGGSPVAGPRTNTATSVSNGLFTVMLDFGVDIFTGADRWLEIAARTNGTGAFTTLSPRQQLTPVPYAITAGNVAGPVSASQLSGTIAPANIANGTISGDKLVVGAVGSNQLAAGAVTTTTLADGAVTASKMATVPYSNWVVLTTFTNPTPADNDNFGLSVAAVGTDRVLIGTPFEGVNGDGVAYLFSTAGMLLSTFTPLLNAENFGFSVAAVGSDWVLIGAPDMFRHPLYTNAGKAYLFNINGTGTIIFNNPTPADDERFGHSVAAVGTDQVLIGAPYHNVFANSGAAYLFSTNGTLLKTFADPRLAGFGDNFGWSVAAVGTDRVLIGTRGEYHAGAAYLFDTNGTWLTTFTNPTPTIGDHFGVSMAAVGTDRVLIGATRENAQGEDLPGAAYLFSTNGTCLMTFTNPTPAVGDNFGLSVAAVGSDRVLIGAPSPFYPGPGTAYLFSIDGWLLNTFDNPTPADGDRFGSATAALGSDRVLIAALGDDRGATNAGAAYLFNFESTDNYVPGLFSAGVVNHSITAASFDNSVGVWSKSGPSIFYNYGNVGIGTDTPTERLSVAGNILATGTITGNGAGLTALNASQLTSGTVADARIAGTIARYTQILPAVLAGDGAGSGLNADLLDGLSSSAFWKTDGNAGTTPGTHFLGTTDNQPLELKANGVRGWRLEPGSTPNVIGGDSGNTVSLGAIGAVIAGGRGHSNQANFATIGGGQSNVVSGIHGVVGGGVLNRASGSSAATVAGGLVNTAGGTYATVGGGRFNSALAFVSSVNGGQGNFIQTDADHSVIGGGLNNLINGLSYRGVIAGGGGNTIGVFSDYGTISGGQENDIAGDSFYTTIGGGYDNNIGVSAEYSFIGGGTNNTIADDSGYSSIGGGRQNAANSGYSTIGGGSFHTISANSANSTIGGGWANSIRDGSYYSTIAGGQSNDIATNSYNSTIGGGFNNNVGTNSTFTVIAGGQNNNIGANSAYATIPGGDRNFATNRAFAAGTRAKANHTGAFVWGDSQNTDFASTSANQFLIRAGGGMGVNVAQPLGKLHVGTSSNVPPLSLASHAIIIDNAAENGRAAFLALAGPGGSATTNRVEVQVEASENQRGGIIGTTSNHEMVFRQNNVTRMRLATNGNIGIGEGAPEGFLHVTGAGSAAPQLRLEQSVNNNFARLRFASTTKPYWDVAVGGTENVMNWFSSGVGNNVMTLTTNGTLTTVGPVNPPSDRNVKSAFEPVNARSILEKVAALPLMSWAYTNSPGIRHIGPVAQDFYAAFGVGTDDKHIATVDADGVALAAIQGLNQKLEEKDAEIQSLKKRLANLEKLIMKDR
jgi:hypothetical protein